MALLLTSPPSSLLSKDPNPALRLFPLRPSKAHSLSFSLLPKTTTTYPRFSSIHYYSFSSDATDPISGKAPATAADDDDDNSVPAGVVDEWGERAEPEAEPLTKLSEADPPRDEDEWGGVDAGEGYVVDEWGERAEPEAEPSTKLSDADPPRDEDEWGGAGVMDDYAISGNGGAGAAIVVDDKLMELKRCLVDTVYGTDFGFRASVEVRAVDPVAGSSHYWFDLNRSTARRLLSLPEMESSISSLAYKGSIAEAIAEAKRQKKIFVVYISGDNVESSHLEESTWMDSNVAESISKYCILLHISEGSTDDANFSAIYPRSSTPCITAIGYNGVQLWRNEGFVTADSLASSLVQACLTLHIQETTATLLTAALASKKSEPHGTNSSDSASFAQGSSSSIDVASPSTDKEAQYAEAIASANSKRENKGADPTDEEINSKLGNKESLGSVVANVLEDGEVEGSISSTETARESLSPVKVDPNDAGVGHMSSCARDECPTPEGNFDVVDHHSEVTTETSEGIANVAKAEAVEDDKIDSEVTTKTSQGIANKATEAVQDKKADAVEEGKIDVLDSSSGKSTDVHLNIRLLDGANLQEKFLVTSTLRMVKDYVDENQSNAVGSYDLAIPYPRKVFNDQDLNKTLSELGLFGRQALIVVPHHRATDYHRGGSSRNQTISTTDLDSSNRSDEGYFAFMKRVLSYMNPLSYIGGGASSSNSSQESQSGMWQYSPNPALQNNLRGTVTPYTVYPSNQSAPAAGRNNSNNRQASSSRFGSNIHTLKHDEDDSQFRDRNAFWNGNSTQYGGDNDSK